MPLQRPKISCIIPTYNRFYCLKETIDSVLSQDFDSFELIIVDDGSKDNTPVLVKKYGKRLRYIKQPNKGVSAARNLGLEISRGEYIAYLDSDDLWAHGKLALQNRFLDQHPEYGLCYTEEIWYKKGVRINQGKRHRKYSGYIFKKCLPLCLISPSSAMIRRTVFNKTGGFDEQLPAAEDYDLWLRITACYPVFLIPLPLIIKKGGHEDQLSTRTANLDKYRIASLVKLLSSQNLCPDYRQAAASELMKKCTIYANGCKKRGRIKEAMYYIELAGGA